MEYGSDYTSTIPAIQCPIQAHLRSWSLSGMGGRLDSWLADSGWKWQLKWPRIDQFPNNLEAG